MPNLGVSAMPAERREATDVPTVSVIIATKNRTEDLADTVRDLISQTQQPNEILIVDQSSTPSFDPTGFQIKIDYIFAPHLSGAAVARNVAMDHASGDIWLFLDDDVILEADYIEQVLAAYSPEISGVSGIITNYSVPGLTRRLFEKVFVKGAFHDDRQPIYWRADHLRFKGPQRVKQFGCGVMSFRADVIRGLRFDPRLSGCSLAEDIDFCAHLPQGAILVIAPRARLIHKRSAVGRATAHWLDAHAQSSAYMRLRNWHRGLNDDLSFTWLQIGYGVMAAVGSLKRGSFEPFSAWQVGRARGRSLGLQHAAQESHARVKETIA